ncbi:hypothetical protein H072_5967 [Dactylellina haptotyla CBS 200.50]|uniref:Transcription factor CBF/NF-Y/archaeal histone domain-containing protein n=1 Tax=Dactylellina haptotyla (strain CBS 200.50) TaxID=1284197 RepID=S8AG91_DACHA|nr:hypothetical protein H072_5967 [Dactylellina haptotyla CBS 200.50]
MPYNNNPISPKRKREEWDGTTYLPLARVRKIIKLDDDIDACTPAAAFLISIAAEEFIWHLADAAHKMTKVEKKPRKNIQYKDLANAVARMDNLEFLSDVIPRTVPFAKALLKLEGGAKKKKKGGEENGSTTTPGKGETSARGAIMNISGREEEASDGSSPAEETTRLKDLHLSNQPASSAKKGKKTSRDVDGDTAMH